MDWSSFSRGNAAGFIKGPGKEFDDMLRSDATEITIGSITVDPRDGNPGNVYHLEGDGTSVNALGLPNRGLKITMNSAMMMASHTRACEKKLWWSVAGFSPAEYRTLVFEFARHGGIELNLGCPNVWKEEGQKPIASFNLDLIEEIIYQTRDILFNAMRVKLSPYSDPSMIPRVAAVLMKYADSISAVVTCNTFPNGIAVKDGTTRVLNTSGGYGGVGGNAMHNIALGQVSQWKAALAGSDIKVIGVGGVDYGKRLLNMHVAGADGVQIGTAFGMHGAGIFSSVVQEAMNYVD